MMEITYHLQFVSLQRAVSQIIDKNVIRTISKIFKKHLIVFVSIIRYDYKDYLLSTINVIHNKLVFCIISNIHLEEIISVFFLKDNSLQKHFYFTY